MITPKNPRIAPPSFTGAAYHAAAFVERAALLDVVDPNVRISFGEENGRDVFRTMWLVDPPSGRDIWTELSRVLDLGGRCKEANSFTGSRVRLRQAPRETAPVVAFLTYALVHAGGAGDPRSSWAPVAAPDGRKGFVARRFLRSSVELRAFFSRRDGVWRLVTLVSGD